MDIAEPARGHDYNSAREYLKNILEWAKQTNNTGLHDDAKAIEYCLIQAWTAMDESLFRFETGNSILKGKNMEKQQTLFETQEEAKTAYVPAVNVQRLVSKPLLLHGDCLEMMELVIASESIDLTVTSPPYDNLRTYNGNIAQWNEDKWRAIIKELYRVTKQGGVVVWVVGDATVKGSETGTSFKQALWAMDCGFNLHDTMIWNKKYIVPKPSNRYENSMEYMFVWSKGKPGKVNLIKDKVNVGYGRKITGNKKNECGEPVKLHGASAGKTVSEFGTRHNVWVIDPARGKKGNSHPAPYPEQLAHDHIISWSNEGDTVFDPFLGSGTTGKMAKLLGRKFVGCEIDKGYFELATKRIEAC